MSKTALDTSRQWELIYTSHGNNFLSNKPTDQYYDDRPLLKFLRSKSMPAKGGERLIVPVNHGGGQGGVGTYTRGSQFSLVDRDPITVAKYPWAYYKATVVVDAIEEHEAGGAGAKLDMVKIKIEDAIESLMDRVSEDLLASSQATDGVLPLQLAIPVDPTASVEFGNINGSTSTWWRSQTDDTGTVFASAGLDAMRSMFNNCTVKGRKPELILTTQTVHEKYEDLVEGKHDITTGASSGAGRVGDAGFGNGMAYKGVPIMWDEDAATPQSGKMFFLNSKGVQLIENKGHAFALQPFQNLLPTGQHARAAIITWWGQLGVRERRLLGQISQIS